MRFRHYLAIPFKLINVLLVILMTINCMLEVLVGGTKR